MIQYSIFIDMNDYSRGRFGAGAPASGLAPSPRMRKCIPSPTLARSCEHERSDEEDESRHKI